MLVKRQNWWKMQPSVITRLRHTRLAFVVVWFSLHYSAVMFFFIVCGPFPFWASQRVGRVLDMLALNHSISSLRTYI